MGTLGVFLFWLCILGIYAFRVFVGLPSSHSLLPYQGGVLYARGRPVREVGSGKHWVIAGSQKILFVDKRPVQVCAEARAVTLADGGTAIFGFAASAQIQDVKKALYASGIYSQIPAFVTLCVARSVLNHSHMEAVRTGQAALAEQIILESREKLASAGYELLSFRFTQLSIAVPVLH
jgi:hypothetical protein